MIAGGESPFCHSQIRARIISQLLIIFSFIDDFHWFSRILIVTKKVPSYTIILLSIGNLSLSFDRHPEGSISLLIYWLPSGNLTVHYFEHGPNNPQYLLKIVIFHSFLYVYQRVFPQNKQPIRPIPGGFSIPRMSKGRPRQAEVPVEVPRWRRKRENALNMTGFSSDSLGCSC